MTAKEIVAELETLGNESHKRIMLKHGAQEPIFGVKIEDLKKIQKRIKKDHRLALELYDTGISDAMYLAGLIADDAKMTSENLEALGQESQCAPAQRVHGSLGCGGKPGGARARPEMD